MWSFEVVVQMVIGGRERDDEGGGGRRREVWNWKERGRERGEEGERERERERAMDGWMGWEDSLSNRQGEVGKVIDQEIPRESGRWEMVVVMVVVMAMVMAMVMDGHGRS